MLCSCNFPRNLAEIKKIGNPILYWQLCYTFLLPFLQFPFCVKTNPSGQTHATVLIGRVFVTTHLWFPEHGLPIWHGFWQISWMHANFAEQSWSTLHSGVSTLGTELNNDQGFNLFHCFSNTFTVLNYVYISKDTTLHVLTFGTWDISIALKRIITSTCFSMIFSSTRSTRRTRITRTKGLTLLFIARRQIIAFFLRGTIRIGNASNLNTRNQWISLHSTSAKTNCLVIFSFTFSPTTT